MPQRPVVEEVLAFEGVPVDQPGSRRAVVLWSDGTVGEAARWFDDEVALTEGDLLGRTRDEIRALHFRRDREWLTRSDPDDRDTEAG